EDEGDPAALRKGAQPLQLSRALPKLRAIATLELRPSAAIMAEPFPQCSRGSDVPDPFIDRGIGLFHPTRPQTIDQDSVAIIGRGRFIGALELDAGCRDFPRHRRFESFCFSSSLDTGAVPLALFVAFASIKFFG